MGLGPFEFFLQVAKVRSDGNVVRPRLQPVVDVILGGGDVVEEQSWHGELRVERVATWFEEVSKKWKH